MGINYQQGLCKDPKEVTEATKKEEDINVPDNSTDNSKRLLSIYRREPWVEDTPANKGSLNKYKVMKYSEQT